MPIAKKINFSIWVCFHLINWERTAWRKVLDVRSSIDFLKGQKHEVESETFHQIYFLKSTNIASTAPKVKPTRWEEVREGKVAAPVDMNKLVPN